MLNKSKMLKLAYKCENIVYTDIKDIAMAIQLHAELGQFEMEIFVDKKKAQRFASRLRKKKYYCVIFNFKALENQSRLYVSWMSDL